MEIEGSIGDNLPNVCEVDNVKVELNKDNIDEPSIKLESGAERMLIPETIIKLSASNNPSETIFDANNSEIIEIDSSEHAKIVSNIMEPMIISAPIAKCIHDDPSDVINDVNNKKLVDSINKSPINSDTETSVPEPIVPESTSDNLPNITADGSNSNIVETDYQAKTTVSSNIESMVISAPIGDSSAINDSATAFGGVEEEKGTEIQSDGGVNTVGNDIESMIIAAPITKISDKPVEVSELKVQMTDALRGIAAAYSDSSDDEAEIRIVGEQITIPDPVGNTNYRCRESDDETDSEEDSSSSESSSESANASDSDSNDGSVNSNKPKNRHERKKTEKGEYDNLPPIEDLNISVPEVLCNPVGKVGWMVEQMVVVTQLKETKASNPTLNIDTVLFIERGRRVLGRIFDVFGTVSDPHYCVRFNDAQHIKENKIEVGMTVYYCPNTPYTTLVFMADLMKMKASDDVGDDEHPAFSDDEEERAYYSSLKQKQVNNNGNKNDKNTEVPKKRPCVSGNKTGWKSKHPWNNDRRTQQRQQQPQQHRNPNSYNNMQQQNTWQHPPAQYNHWTPTPHHNNWPRPFSMESRSHYSSSSFQSNVDFSLQPRPTFMWPNNGTTFTPTQTQSAPWRAPAPPPPPFPLQSPPPPPPGI